MRFMCKLYLCCKDTDYSLGKHIISPKTLAFHSICTDNNESDDIKRCRIGLNVCLYYFVHSLYESDISGFFDAKISDNYYNWLIFAEETQ